VQWAARKGCLALEVGGLREGNRLVAIDLDVRVKPVVENALSDRQLLRNLEYVRILDEEEGRKSLFGGLAASGWHVGSVCMKLLVANGQRQIQEAIARGEKVAVWGPSPGFRELRWIRPVLAGDTIAFASEVASKRTSEKRPEWGIMQALNTGTNQRGELAFSVLATAFVPRRSGG